MIFRIFWIVALLSSRYSLLHSGLLSLFSAIKNGLLHFSNHVSVHDKLCGSFQSKEIRP